MQRDESPDAPRLALLDFRVCEAARRASASGPSSAAGRAAPWTDSGSHFSRTIRRFWRENGLARVVVHPGGKAPVAVPGHRVRGEGDDAGPGNGMIPGERIRLAYRALYRTEEEGRNSVR